MRGVATRVAGAAVLAATTGGLWWAGQGRLAAPPVTDGAALRAWLAERDGIVAAFALLRLLGLGLAAYLLVLVALGLLAQVTRLPALGRLAAAATVPGLRRHLAPVVGVGLLAVAGLPGWVPGTPAAGLTPGPAPHPAPPATSSVPPDTGTGTDPAVAPREEDGEGTASLRIEPAPAPDPDGERTGPIGGGPARSGDRTARPPLPVGDPGAGGAGQDPAADPPASWTVEAGDHLWHIAGTVLGQAWGRPATDREIVPYWRDLIEANRPVLVDPRNPDLIHPGQVVHLPAPPPR